MIRGRCEICEEEVFSYQRAAFPVSGWELERESGGANQIKGRVRRPNRIVHAHCLENKLRRRSLGIEGQMELIE